ncbi:response regulator [Terricaulis sp.]|uniref:response regulator n=1 Tax=Terricaulis sp. TaxID=2768686 RepID=UPI003784D7FC
MSAIDRDQKVNLSLASVLIIDASAHSLEIMVQIVKGFGAQDIHRAQTLTEAERVLRRTNVDLILIDPALKDEDGVGFIRTLRAEGKEPNRFVPIILISGFAPASKVGAARDSGANFFIVKPVSPKVLLERILWIARDNRPFVAMDDGYQGPDRRFKFAGPPIGSDGRRGSDLKDPITDASEPNMSQSEIDALLKPQKVSL